MNQGPSWLYSLDTDIWAFSIFQWAARVSTDIVQNIPHIVQNISHSIKKYNRIHPSDSRNIGLPPTHRLDGGVSCGVQKVWGQAKVSLHLCHIQSCPSEITISAYDNPDSWGQNLLLLPGLFFPYLHAWWTELLKFITVFGILIRETC